MDHTQIVKFCKDLGCCDVCCLRYLGIRNPISYENVHQVVHKYLDQNNQIQESEVTRNTENKWLELEKGKDITLSDSVTTDQVKVVSNSNQNIDNLQEGTTHDEKGPAEPPAKRIRLDNVCVSCLGILQEETWPESFTMVQELLEKKCYECDTIACALSSPIATIMRERAVTLRLQDAFPDYEQKSATSLKEAWKWTFGRRMAALVRKQLDSGAVAPLLVTLSLEYPDEPAELEALRALAPALFRQRGRQRRRFGVEFTRRAAEQALEGATLAALGAAPAPARCAARPVSAQAAHAPAYLGGRYLKLSRTLPQTPWLVAGRRMMPSSVQEIIVAPLAAAYGLSADEAAARIKFMSAGREDVDVRCLGTGRPFALEVADPRRLPAEDELRRACEEISAGGQVVVRSLVPVAREQLAQLKRGEQARAKTYEALCVKLEGGGVSARELAALRAWRGALQQRTPLRVLHRRALRRRARRVQLLRARGVAGAPALLLLRLRADAGTYVKEWAHGELGRTRPALRDVLGARADILALDVADVELAWPPAPPGPAAPPAPPGPAAPTPE